MDKKAIYLLLGIAIAVLFIAIPDVVFEALYRSENAYSDDMYNNGIYRVLAIVTVVMTWGIAAIYYYVINSVKFDRWWHWLAMLAIAAVLTPVACYITNNSMLPLSDMDYGSQAMQLELCNVLLSAVLFIVASFSLRWWSTNCRHTPIPQ